MQVSKEEFDEFIASYPNKLDRDVATMCIPPVLCYYDFSDNDGYDAIVATLTREIDVNYKETGEIKYKIIDTTVKPAKSEIRVIKSNGGVLKEGEVFTPFNPDKCTLSVGGKILEVFGEGKVTISRSGEDL